MLSFLLFDVGHGFCAYAETPGGANTLFDCGFDNDLQFYPSRYFSDRKINRVSNLILSHFDQDHVCNLPGLRQVVAFDMITRNSSIPADFLKSEKKSGGIITSAMASAIEMHENWTVLVAVPPNYGELKVTNFFNHYPTFTDTNNLSVVTFLEYEGFGIVIPGDLERAGWKELLKNSHFCECLRGTKIFIASHHGRYAGYCEDVFEYCTPDIVVLSDKNIVHSSQEHDYTRHASGIEWNTNETRYVLTTRSDGHILITKKSGERPFIRANIRL